MSSNPYGHDPQQPSDPAGYSQGYGSAPQPPYGQQPAAPTNQPPAPTYAQTNYEQPTYGQSTPDPYGQPSYGQPYTQQYGQAPGYGQQQYGAGLAPYTPAYDSNPRPSVSMVQAVKLWLKNWKNFSGRASRSEYWWVILALSILEAVLVVVMIIGTIVAAAADSGSGDLIGTVFILVWGLMAVIGLATVVPTVALGVRRLHDTNQSGWLHLVSLLGGIGSIIMIVLCAQPSSPAGARFDDAAQPLYGPENI